MKIHRITLTGFGPFRGTEIVDFDTFVGDGKFVITGKTGAGKSTILDAITFALFGHVPRYGNVTDARVRSDYLKQSTDVTEVVLEFSTARARHRVTRRPGYSVPGRKTPLPPFAEIEELRGGDWEVLASRRLTDVSRKIDDVVGLSASQFQQVILLAQGQFEEFLVAESSKRRTLLRQLFDTGRFLDYSTDLDSRAAEMSAGLAVTTAAIETNIANLASVVDQSVPDGLSVSRSGDVLTWADDLLLAQRAVLGEARAAAQRTRVVCDRARAALTRAQTTRDCQQRRLKATAQLDLLLAEAEEIEAARVRLRAAQDAEVVWIAVEAQRRSAVRLAEAATQLAEARGLFEQRLGETRLEGTALQEHLAERESSLQAEESRLAELARSEATLATLARNLARARAECEAASSEQKRLETRRDELRESLPELDQSAADLADAPQELGAAEQALDALSARLSSARLAEAIDQDLAAAARARQSTSAQVASAATDRTGLLGRQWGEYASVLAANLIDGDACAVCGSTEHPARAQAVAEHVTEGDLERAEAAVDAALQADQEAAALVTRLQERLTHARAGAGGTTVESLTGELREAEDVVAARRAAVREFESVNTRRAAVGREIADVELAVDAAKEARHVAVTDMTVLESSHDSKHKAVEEARGAYASLTEYLDVTRGQLAAVRQLLRSLERHATNADVAQRDASTLDELLEKYDFASTEEVVSGRLPAPERSSVQDRVTGHTASLEAQRRILADPELADLPTTPVDLAPLQAGCETADTEHRQATGLLGEVTNRATQVEAYVDRIRSALERAGTAQQEFELVDALARAVRGQSPNTKKMTLETFALAADLEEIVTAANVLLARMTSHRYELKYSDELAKGGAQSGLSIDVVDAYNSETRSPRSLSGGEKFQASLALALGLAEVVTQRNGGVRLDTLFIDEGFGALDTETLDTTLDTIDSLREGGRTVGLISHVDQVKERIPQHIQVSVTPQGWSVVETGPTRP